MPGVALGLLLPVLAVWLALHAWRLLPAGLPPLVSAAVAFGGGMGLSALTTIWLLAAGLSLGPAFVGLDAVLWATLGVLAWRRLRAAPAVPVPPAARVPLTTLDRLARAAFVAVALVAIATAVTEYLVQPHGQWDAWAIWNQKARFLLRGGTGWTAELGVDFSNPGHPLLVPATVARLWAYAGGEITLAPALVAGLFGAAVLGTIMGALDLHRARAWLAGAALIAPATYVKQVMSQQADVPFGFFVVATLVLLRKDDAAAWLDRHETRVTLLLAGLLTGLATWTKNEGLVFTGIVVLLLAWVLVRHGRPAQAGWWALGAAPALLTVVWFKLWVAPVTPPYLDEGSTLTGLLGTLLSPARHALVLPLVWDHAARWGGAMAAGVVPAAVAAALGAACTPGSRAARGIFAATFLMLGGYYLVYLLAPLDIVWLVDTSFDRLTAQIWPTLVLAAFSAGSLATGAPVTGGRRPDRR